MWGDVFGMVADRFGVLWMVNIAQPQGWRRANVNGGWVGR